MFPRAQWYRSYHEAAGHVGLKDVIEGAVREGAAVEGEDLGNIAHTLLILSAAVYEQRTLRFIGARFVLGCTWRVEYALQIYFYGRICRMARVSDGY